MLPVMLGGRSSIITRKLQRKDLNAGGRALESIFLTTVHTVWYVGFGILAFGMKCAPKPEFPKARWG